MKEVKRFETWSRYCGSNWDFEHASKYILQLENNELIEAGYFIHFYNAKIVKNVIELPTSIGCPMQCKFCASSSIPFIRKMSVKEEFLVLDHIYKRETLSVQSPLIISFTGIGDLFFTFNTVERTILDIASINNDIQFIVSSCHWTFEMFKRMEQLYNKVVFRAIQITYISFRKIILHDIIGYCRLDPMDNFCFENVIEHIRKSSIPNFSINYLLLSDLNDSRKDFLDFLSLLMPIKDKICVRISKLNITKACKANQISASTLKKMKELKKILEENGINAYLFYTMEDNGIGCGQLLSEI